MRNQKLQMMFTQMKSDSGRTLKCYLLMKKFLYWEETVQCLLHAPRMLIVRVSTKNPGVLQSNLQSNCSCRLQIS